MSRRATAWLAWSLCPMSVALAAASLILVLLNGRILDDIFLARGGPPIPPHQGRGARTTKNVCLLAEHPQLAAPR
jgi:hypothetical protein